MSEGQYYYLGINISGKFWNLSNEQWKKYCGIGNSKTLETQNHTQLNNCLFSPIYHIKTVLVYFKF